MVTQERPPKDRLTPTQTRAARRARRQRRTRLKRSAIISAVALIAFVFIVSLFAGSIPISLGGEDTADVGKRVSGVQGGVGNLHIEPGDPPPDPYTSVPATSGWHYSARGLAPAPWTVYDDPLPDEVLVHNLEHGGVGIHYDCPNGCDDLILKLREIALNSSKVIMFPYPGMDTRIALTAWTYIDRFDEFDEDRITQFIDAHVSSRNAPEWQVR